MHILAARDFLGSRGGARPQQPVEIGQHDGLDRVDAPFLPHFLVEVVHETPFPFQLERVLALELRPFDLVNQASEFCRRRLFLYDVLCNRVPWRCFQIPVFRVLFIVKFHKA